MVWIHDRPDASHESFELEVEEDGFIHTEDLVLEPLGGGRWRMRESPVLSDVAHYGDVIEATVTPLGALRFVRVVQHSGLESDMFAVSEAFVASDAWRALQERLVDIGGMWEQVAGGIIMIHVPHDGLLMAWEEAELAFDAFRAESGEEPTG